MTFRGILSLRKKEQQAARAAIPRAPLEKDALAPVVRRDTVLPLPAGEGRGEGERAEHFLRHWSFISKSLP
jgi:hypothetical protein